MRQKSYSQIREHYIQMVAFAESQMARYHMSYVFVFPYKTPKDNVSPLHYH